jgi:hypothetical protein
MKPETISKNETNLQNQMNRKILKMKNIIFSAIIVSLLFFSQTVNAQINLEHTYDGDVGYGNFYYPVISYYTYTNLATNQVRLYNEDHSLYKSITITPPAGYNCGSVSCFSKNIATTDNKVTFFVSFRNPSVISTDPNKYSVLRLYNEDGTMIKDFGYAYFFFPSIHVVSSNKCRLTIHRQFSTTPTTYETDIYSLPGTAPVGVSNPKSSEFQPPYPNPANNIINLPYQLTQGETSVMRIFNLNGQLIETKQIDSAFDKILLNVSGYTKGMYLYEVNGVSNRFIVD